LVSLFVAENIWLNESIPNLIKSEVVEPETTNNFNQNCTFQKPYSPASSIPFQLTPFDPVAKLMDFGISLHNEMTHQTLACGTRAFASPEQMRRIVQLTPSSDLWSVSVCMWSMLCLCYDVPFDPIDLVLSKSTHPPQIKNYLATKNVSESLCQIIMKGLSVSVDQRWHSAQDMLIALQFEQEKLRQIAETNSHNNQTEESGSSNSSILRNKQYQQNKRNKQKSESNKEFSMKTCPHCKGVGLITADKENKRNITASSSDTEKVPHLSSKF